MHAICHRSSVEWRYCSGICSLSHTVAISLWLVALVLPLLLALGSREFVLEKNFYREQPTIKLADNLLCILEGERDDSGKKQPLTLVHSTFPERIQQLYSRESIRNADVQTFSTDVNSDKIADSVHVEIIAPLAMNETIQQATVVVVLDYTLKDYVKLNMDVLAVVRHSSPFAGDALYADGDLTLHQRSAFDITDTVQHPFIASPIVNMTSSNTTQQVLLQSLISGYRDRNYTANVHVPYPIWTSTANSSQFRVLFNIRIDTVNLLYSTEWPEIAKHMWIEYYCIFVVISTLALYLREYLFTTKLLPSVCVVDEPRRTFATKYQ